MQVIWQDSEEAFRLLYEEETNPRLRPLMESLWLLRTGWTVVEAAAKSGVPAATLEECLGLYVQGGLAAARKFLDTGAEEPGSRDVYEALLDEHRRLLLIVAQGLETLGGLLPEPVKDATVKNPDGTMRKSSAWPPRPIVFAAAAGYAGLCLCFASIWLSGSRTGALNTFLPSALFLLIRIGAATVGLRRLHRGRDQGRPLVRAMLLLLCGALLVDALGELIWVVYNVAGAAVPYPGIPDVAFVANSLAWTVAMGMMFWALDTNLRDEMGSSVSLLAVTWTFTIAFITLVNGRIGASNSLVKVSLDILYPFIWALNSALIGALFLGAQHSRLPGGWRWFVALVYFGSAVLFVGNLGYSITTSLSRNGPSYQYLYYEGGPIDFLFATGDYLLAIGILVFPLHRDPAPPRFAGAGIWRDGFGNER